MRLRIQHRLLFGDGPRCKQKAQIIEPPTRGFSILEKA